METSRITNLHDCYDVIIFFERKFSGTGRGTHTGTKDVLCHHHFLFFRIPNLLFFCYSSSSTLGYCMDIWLDTTNIKTIQRAVRFGILAGVTTNPSLIAHAGSDMETLLRDLLHFQEGPVTAQVVAEEVHEMVQQGQSLHAISNRIIVKVPITQKGLEAIHLLSRQGIPTMATVLFHPRQALMAALAGADYVALYISRMEKAGEDPWIALASMKSIFNNYRFKTQILGASLHTLEHVVKCAEVGIYGATLKDELFEKMVADQPQTLSGVEQFASDWKLLNDPIFVS
jgi:transaldolase